MKELVILSGKGGTGKTTVCAGLAALLPGPKVLVDADVEAANLALVVEARVRKRQSFWAGYTPHKDEDRCSGCGTCRKKCRFEAVREDLTIDPFLCEGCGVCAWFCPEGAIEMREKEVGQIFVSETPYGPLVHAEILPGEENSGKLVAEVKKRARDLAPAASFILVDGPPGIGCPVIASLSGADAVLVVAEPTAAGLHDLGRLVALLHHFKLPGYLVVNKADLNPEITEKLLAYPGLSPLGELPFDEAVASALRKLRPLPLVSHGPAAQALKALALKVQKNILGGLT